MYDELKTTDPERILNALRAAMESEDPVSVTLRKSGDMYAATLVRATEPEFAGGPVT